MHRMAKPAHAQSAGRTEYHTHPTIHGLIADITGDGTGAPGRSQSPWTFVVESDEGGTWHRIGRVEKHHDHRTTYIPDPAPAPAAATA